MRRKCWIGVLAVAALVLSGSASLGGELSVAVGAIGSVAPDGMVGPELSLKLVPLQTVTPGETQPCLWLDVAATTNDFSSWGFVTGLSADLDAIDKLTLGLADRGGFGRDWTRGVWVLYVSRSFSSLFE